MSFYINELVEEQLFEQLMEKLGREPTDDELAEAMVQLGEWEPDWDAIAKDDAIDRDGN